LAFVILFWGVNWPIMKMGLQFVTPLWFAATRMFLGSLCLFAFLALKGRVRLPGRSEIPILVFVAVFQIGLPTGLIHAGLSFMDAGRSAILVFTIPLWVAPMAVFALGERLTRMNVVGITVGLAGIAVLFNPLSFDFSNSSALTGNGFMILASMSFAVAIILIRRHSWTGPIIRLLPWQMLLGTAILVIAAAAIEGRPNFEWSPPLVAILAYNGPIASGFCFWAYITVSRNLPAMSTALGSLGVPVLGVLSSALILGEGISLIIVSGLILISMGVLAITVGNLRQPKIL
jgi:drug/metabolite transporter (DMT)-like permease|tara:strand:+ start:2989 stop:3855 length:867 start_codon:yes stop_codon:yes gene_type:complete